MRCPKDAYNTYLNDWCRECHPNISGIVCTRPKGHKGMHHAHVFECKICFSTWTSTNNIDE